MGAITANASEENAKHLYEFGKNIGIAFQLKDDILDAYGDPEKFGKQIGGDIINNKKTWLLIQALNQSSGKEKEKLLYWLSQKEFDYSEKIEAIKTVYAALNILQQAEEEMNHYYELALKHLSEISVEENKKQELKSFAQALMNRDI
jgi:geranylgeranyl diphosphate synthase type II